MIINGGDYEHTLTIGTTESDRQHDIQYQSKPGYHDILIRRGDFEISECSLSNYIMYRATGDDWITAIPVFPLRAFRHACILVRNDSPLTDFRQLAGRKIGIRDYSQTLAVWVRGILKDEYELDWTTVHWVSSSKQRFQAPAGVTLSTTARDLEDLLLAGEIDAVAMDAPREWQRPMPERRFRTLLPDAVGVERRYFERTGIFPIRHTVVVRKELLDRAPDAAKILFDSYVAAKRSALQRRLSATYLPWGELAWQRLIDIFSGDSHPYGLVPSNRKQLDLVSGYLLDQGFITRIPTIEEMFPVGSAAWSDQ